MYDCPAERGGSVASSADGDGVARGAGTVMGAGLFSLFKIELAVAVLPVAGELVAESCTE